MLSHWYTVASCNCLHYSTNHIKVYSFIHVVVVHNLGGWSGWLATYSDCVITYLIVMDNDELMEKLDGCFVGDIAES